MEVRLFYLLASLLLGLAVSFSASGAKFQPVYSLKNLGEQQDAVGNSFERVQVKCNTGRALRYIHRGAGSDDWCVNGDIAKCFDERIDAATRACSVDRGTNAVPAIAPTATVKSKQPSAELLRKQAERAELQEELMVNQQKKIELRTRQLELRKRELELQVLRDSN
jgi:hypothetical protein